MAAPDASIVKLPAVFDLDALDGVRDRLLENIERGPVRVIGGAVERVATNAVLMLLVAAQTAQLNGYSLALATPSQPLRLAIDRLGLRAAFRAVVEA